MTPWVRRRSSRRLLAVDSAWNRRGWGVAIPMSARRDRGAARQASIDGTSRSRPYQEITCGRAILVTYCHLHLLQHCRTHQDGWSCPQDSYRRMLVKLTAPRSQASESRLYTFSGESKDHLRKFRLTTSRATGPQAVICTPSLTWSLPFGR
jgi:hypothetical protein